MTQSHPAFSGRIDFKVRGVPKNGLAFPEFDEIIQAFSLDEVVPALRQAEQACMRGAHAMGFVCYEAAAAFDEALRTQPKDRLPLVFFGMSHNPINPSPPDAPPIDSDTFSRFTPAWEMEDYLTRFEKVMTHVRAGDTYQINLTFPMHAEFSGSIDPCYHELREAQKSSYCGRLSGPDFTILSLSPELFFERRGPRVVTRPMKGTRKRGRHREEDQRIEQELASSPKDRAENIMIVDLLRNDLGRIAETGSVRVPTLFSIEKYPTVWQMTSTVEGRIPHDLSLVELFRALFPCGSVTGAPKVKSMEIINDLESKPRGVYCGAFGIIFPGGDCVFNVPIRTMTIRNGQAEYPVGSGLVADSDGRKEYEECLVKADSVDRRFRLFETMRWERERGYVLGEGHLARLRRSAELLGFRMNEEELRRRLETAVAGAQSDKKVRLLLSPHGEIAVQTSDLPVDRISEKAVKMADEPVQSGNRYLYHKTTRREVYDRERAKLRGYFDAILYNERGEVTESTIANVTVLIDGVWYTPPIESGLLPGVMRAHLLDKGELVERVITLEDLRKADGMRLLNSVRGLFDVRLMNF